MSLARLLGKYLSGSEIFIPDQRVIMRRYIVLDCRYFGFYVHHLCGRDHESLHNHPWKWSLAFVIAGSYSEERATADNNIVRRLIRTGRINFISQNTFHRINDVSPKGAWTVYIHGPRAQRDGFLMRVSEAWIYRDAKEVTLEATRPTRVS
jgi:hypothetical protein